MAKNKTRTVRRYSAKKKSHVRHKPDVHLLPSVFYAAAAIEPLVTTSGDAATSPIGSLMEAGVPADQKVNNAVYSLGSQIQQDWKSMAEMAIIGYAFQWIGKKTGLSRIGGKRVKLF